MILLTICYSGDLNEVRRDGRTCDVCGGEKCALGVGRGKRELERPLGRVAGY